MLGQANHFARYAKEKIPYAIDRYINETHRLYKVLNAQLGRQAAAGRDYVAGDDISIADFAILDWSNGYANYAIDESEFPHWLAWRDRMRARPATARALAFQLPDKPVDISKDAEAQKVLFGQR
jgi:GST-like protein